MPPAASTSGSARTLVSSDAGIVAEPLVDFSTICLPAMTASVSSYEAAKRPSKVFCIVSVRMNVPLTIETPITTAKAVSSARTLRAASPFRATAIIDRDTSSSTSRMRWALQAPMSRTISPSARNSTRSAIAAACASWVTMTVV